MIPKLLAGLAAASAIGLSGCGTLGGVTAPKASGTELLDAVKSLTSNCSGAFNANLTFAPPLPPSGSLVVNQTCGAAGTAGRPVAAQP